MASDHTVSVDFILVHFWSAVAFETEEHVALKKTYTQQSSTALLKVFDRKLTSECLFVKLTWGGQ